MCDIEKISDKSVAHFFTLIGVEQVARTKRLIIRRSVSACNDQVVRDDFAKKINLLADHIDIQAGRVKVLDLKAVLVTGLVLVDQQLAHERLLPVLTCDRQGDDIFSRHLQNVIGKESIRCKGICFILALYLFQFFLRDLG